MSMVNGAVECDGCGTDVGAGGLGTCVVISRIDIDTGMVENLHLCLDREDGQAKVKGCAGKTLTPARLAYYTERMAPIREQRAAEAQAAAEATAKALAEANAEAEAARAETAARLAAEAAEAAASVPDVADDE